MKCSVMRGFSLRGYGYCLLPSIPQAMFLILANTARGNEKTRSYGKSLTVDDVVFTGFAYSCWVVSNSVWYAMTAKW
jgi:hypothetical protein